MNIDQDIKQYMNYNIIQRGLFIGAFISDLHFPVNNIEPIQQYKILNEQFLDKIALMPKLDMVGILGDIFVKNNKDNFLMIINGKKYEINTFFNTKDLKISERLILQQQLQSAQAKI